MKEKIFVYGAGGHAKVVIDLIEKQALYEIVFLIDDDLARRGQEFFGYTIIGGKDELLTQADTPRKAVVAISSNTDRGVVADWLDQQGFNLVAAIHPSAQLGRGVTVGAGSVVMANAVINAATTIGKNTIVNTRASVDHDCSIGNTVHIAPGATLCGLITVDDGSFIAAGATVIPNLTIGQHVTVGAGAVVVLDVPGSVTVVGNPAKIKS